MKVADWIFFIKYAADWILDGLLKPPQLAAWKRLMRNVKELTNYEFTEAQLCDFEDRIIQVNVVYHIHMLSSRI